MSLLKQFWIYATLLLALAIGVMALVIWDSADSSSPATIPDIIKQSSKADKESSAELASDKPVPSNFPAPAKKLHQLINDTDSQLSDTQSLDGKIEQLDKQLAEINEQLKAQGINVPEQQPQTAATQSDTETRLKAIKDHIDRKPLSSN